MKWAMLAMYECRNGHQLTADNVKFVQEKRFSKRKGTWVVYHTVECRRCRRVTKKLAMRKRRLQGKSKWKLEYNETRKKKQQCENSLNKR